MQYFYINDNNLTSLPDTFLSHFVKKVPRGTWNRFFIDVADLRNNALDVKSYPRAERHIVDVKTLKAILNDKDAERREKYHHTYLYDGDHYLGHLDFSSDFNVNPTFPGR